MAGIGPFDSFAFPGTYTQTFNEPPLVSAAGALRIPAFIGVANEVTPITAYEMIRGSSSMADNKITKEDVSSQVTGTNRNFLVTFKPLVTGTGGGVPAVDPRAVTVYVNDNIVPVASIDSATGTVYLVGFPTLGDTVEITYYFKRMDTLITNDDLSEQANGVLILGVPTGNKVFKVENVPIVDGTNGGITTTDPTKVIFTVNAVRVSVTAVDGDTGLVTLAQPPLAGDTVLATYYTNTYQDTYDILPSNRVAAITRVGYSPSTTDFVDTADYVLDTTGSFNTINWGNSAKIAHGSLTTGFSYFYGQLSDTLYDNRNFRRLTSGTSDSTNTTFTLEYTPTTGSGLGKPTDSTSLVTAYVGTIPTTATPVTVTEVDASLGTITLKTPPAAGQKVYVTQYQNMLPDDNWTLDVKTAGAAGLGTYGITGVNTGIGYNILWSLSDTTVTDPYFAVENVTYPAGIGAVNSDAQVMPGYGLDETISLTFSDSTKYVVTSSVTGGTGSAGDNTGYLNQTYMDGKTGFRVTVLASTSVAYVAGNKIGYRSSATVLTGAVPTRAVPGLKLFATDTLGTDSGNTALLNTYNKSGNEPRIGDFYYVSFNESKNFDSNGLTKAAVVALEKDALAFTGGIASNNKLGMAAHLAFLNGAPAMALLQVLRTTGGTDAPDSRYIKGIDYFNIPLPGNIRPSLMEPVTTSIPVLSYLKTSNVIQSSIRQQNERMSYFGFANNTSPTTAMTFAQSMNSERMTGIYPDGGFMPITDELGNSVDFLVDGSLLAAAISGRDTSPAYDVAEPLTHKPVVGFSRLFRRMDPVTQAQVCNSGITLLEEQAAGIIVKMDLTTDVSSVLTRTPSVIRIKDFVQKGTRSALNPYIGMKYLTSRGTEVEKTLSSYLSALQAAQIITGFTGVKATPNANEPTTLDVVAYYSPVLPLLWIIVTYNLRSLV